MILFANSLLEKYWRMQPPEFLQPEGLHPIADDESLFSVSDYVVVDAVVPGPVWLSCIAKFSTVWAAAVGVA